jgi:molecular chaperone GrpE
MNENLETPDMSIPEAEPIIANEEVGELRTKLDKAEQQNTDLLRTLAEFQNSRKREARDLEVERKFAHSKFANDLLSALDNLDRALLAAKQTGDKSPLVMGVMATQLQILDALKRHGIVRIEAMGAPFDANFHQAVSLRQTGDVEPNRVVEVLQQGFMIHDRVLRPASVIISATPTVPVKVETGA